MGCAAGWNEIQMTGLLAIPIDIFIYSSLFLYTLPNTHMLAMPYSLSSSGPSLKSVTLIDSTISLRLAGVISQSNSVCAFLGLLSLKTMPNTLYLVKELLQKMGNVVFGGHGWIELNEYIEHSPTFSQKNNLFVSSRMLGQSFRKASENRILVMERQGIEQGNGSTLHTVVQAGI